MQKNVRSKYIDFIVFTLLGAALMIIGVTTKRAIFDIAGAILLFFALDAFVSIQIYAGKKKRS